MPEAAQTIIESARKNDLAFQQALGKLDCIAHRFDHLDQVVGQLGDKLDKFRAAFDEFASSPAAAAVARANQMTVAAVNLKIVRCVVDAVESTLLLEVEAFVIGENQAPVPYRTVSFFLNSSPLASLATDEAGQVCLRDPPRITDLKLQRKNLLQVRVKDSSKAVSAELKVLEPPDIYLEEFDPEDLISEDEGSSSRTENYAFTGSIDVKLKPEDFLDVAGVECVFLINGERVDRFQADSRGRIKIKFKKEYRIRHYDDGDKSGEPPFSWVKRGRNRMRIAFDGLPDWYSHEADLR